MLGLQDMGLQGAGVAGWLQAQTKPVPKGYVLGACHGRTSSSCLLSCSRRGFGWSQGAPLVCATMVAAQVFPMGFSHRSGQPILLSPISIRFQLKPNAFFSLSCRFSPSKNETNTHGLQFELQLN